MHVQYLHAFSLDVLKSASRRACSPLADYRDSVPNKWPNVSVAPLRSRQQPLDMVREGLVGIRLIKEWCVTQVRRLARHSRHPRGQDSSNGWVVRSDPRSEREAIDPVSQVDIRKQHLDRFATFENRLCVFSGPRFQNAVSTFPKKIAHGQAD